MRAWIGAILLLVAAEAGLRAFESRSSSASAVVPAWTVHHRLGSVKQGRVLPLAGIPNRDTRLCVEEDDAVVYRSDRHGFNNPDSVWDSAVEGVLLGDSYIHGHCLPAERHVAGLLRASGARVLNLGLTGSGPLSQWGAWQEYGSRRKPRWVVWTFLLNDLFSDLEAELKEPRLRGYLTRRTQDLWNARPGAEEGVSSNSLESSAATPGLRLPGALFALVMRAFRPHPIKKQVIPPPPARPLEELFLRIVLGARQEIEASGASFRFVYIPDALSFAPAFRSAHGEIADRILTRLRGAGVRVIDLREDLTANGRSPYEFYAALGGYYGHFNAEGQALHFDRLR